MRWLKCGEAAAYAGGFNKKLLYAAARDGKLRVAYVGAGRNWVTCEQWIDDWLAACAEPNDIRHLREVRR